MQKFYFNITINHSLLIGLVLLFSSCNAIFEKDITDKDLTLVLPVNGQVYSTNQVNFKWEELEGATDYRIEIVSPNYANIQSFILDTLVSGDTYSYILSPGNYEFQIRAENSAYKSNFVGPFSITIDSVSDLSNQLVQLLLPQSDFYTNSTSINCSWQNLYAADKYEFQLRSGLDFNNSNSTSHIMTDIYSTNYTIPSNVLQEGKFSWGIKAHNQNSSSDFSVLNFIIDLTDPVDVDLLLPIDNDSPTLQTVVFKWGRGTDPGTVHSPVTTTIEISSDINFLNTIVYQNNITTDSLEHTFSTAGDYWWRVLANDEAGNQSVSYLETRKITIP